MKFKNLTEVEKIDNMPDGAAALIIDGDEIKQTTGVGGGGGYNLVISSDGDNNFTYKLGDFASTKALLLAGEPILGCVCGKHKNYGSSYAARPCTLAIEAVQYDAGSDRIYVQYVDLDTDGGGSLRGTVYKQRLTLQSNGNIVIW